MGGAHQSDLGQQSCKDVIYQPVKSIKDLACKFKAKGAVFYSVMRKLAEILHIKVGANHIWIFFIFLITFKSDQIK